MQLHDNVPGFHSNSMATSEPLTWKFWRLLWLHEWMSSCSWQVVWSLSASGSLSGKQPPGLLHEDHTRWPINPSVWSHSLLALTEAWSWSSSEVVFTTVWQGMVMPRRKWNSPLLGPCWSGWSPVYREAKFSDFPSGESKSLIQPKRQKPHGWNSKTKIIKIEVTGSLNFPANIRISPTASWMGDQPGSSRKNQAVYSLIYEGLIPSPVNCMLNQIYLW